MQERHITLPGLPMTVNYWSRANPGMQHRMRKEEKERLVRAIVRAGAQPVSGPVSLELTFVFDTNRKRDLDNLCKFPLDALVEAGIIEGDSWQVLSGGLHLHGRLDRRGRPRVEVTIRTVEEASA